MHFCTSRAAALTAAVVVVLTPTSLRAQHDDAMPGPAHESAGHEMWSAGVGGGWRLLGMAQAFPVVTLGAPGHDASPLHETRFYLTQPALMINLESPAQRVVLRTTLNFEGLTLENGELTYGGWGEGFIDKRHPHTLLHELMLSLNLWQAAGGALSFSAGKGFAPYGTDDPMARPGLKYPTNHHLSQILERWTLNGVWLRDGWSLEAGLFGGTEPEDPYDLSNIESFGDSWSARVARRWGAGAGPMAEWEASASYGDVAEEHHGETERTRLWNVALRHARPLRGEAGHLYALIEASLSEPEHEDGYFSALGETRLAFGRHQPYLRVEYATRPEYEREGAAGTDDFFRYHHDDAAIGATRWLIGTVAWAYELTGYPVSVRPFAETQYHRVREERGGIDPDVLFGTDSFWSLTLGARVFLGGDPMRMDAYGVLDPMTSMHRMMGPGAEMNGHDAEPHAPASHPGQHEH